MCLLSERTQMLSFQYPPVILWSFAQSAHLSSDRLVFQGDRNLFMVACTLSFGIHTRADVDPAFPVASSNFTNPLPMFLLLLDEYLSLPGRSLGVALPLQKVPIMIVADRR